MDVVVVLTSYQGKGLAFRLEENDWEWSINKKARIMTIDEISDII